MASSDDSTIADRNAVARQGSVRSFSGSVIGARIEELQRWSRDVTSGGQAASLPQDITDR
jgi:hypothetical protein